MKNGTSFIFIILIATLYSCSSSRSTVRNTASETNAERNLSDSTGTVGIVERDSAAEREVERIEDIDREHIRINYGSDGKITEVFYDRQKTSRRDRERQQETKQDKQAVSSAKKVNVTEGTHIKQESNEKEKKDIKSGCSLSVFLIFMFFYLSALLIYDNRSKIKAFFIRLWRK